MRFSTALLSLFLVFNLYAQHDGHHQKPMTENKGVQSHILGPLLRGKIPDTWTGPRA